MFKRCQVWLLSLTEQIHFSKVLEMNVTTNRFYALLVRKAQSDLTSPVALASISRQPRAQSWGSGCTSHCSIHILFLPQSHPAWDTDLWDWRFLRWPTQPRESPSGVKHSLEGSKSPFPHLSSPHNLASQGPHYGRYYSNISTPFPLPQDQPQSKVLRHSQYNRKGSI